MIVHEIRAHSEAILELAQAGALEYLEVEGEGLRFGAVPDVLLMPTRRRQRIASTVEGNMTLDRDP